MNIRTTLLGSAVLAAATVAAAPAEEPQYDMTKYQFVMLARDGAKPASTGPDEARHRALLAGLVARGVAIVEGPVQGAGFVELVVLDVPDAAAALAALKEDPLVASGTLVPRALTWMSAKGQLQPPADPAVPEDAVLGLLVRPKDAPDLPREKIEELQAGHMANIRAMHAAGDLVTAGPFVDGGDMRGVFVFRTTDMERLRQLVARDPAVAAHRLALQLYPWRIAKGTLPPLPAGAARAQDPGPPRAYVPITGPMLVLDAGAYVASPFHWNREQALRAVAVAGLIGATILVDEEVQRWIQDRRTPATDNVAEFFTRIGIALPVAAGGTAWVLGRTRDDPDLRRMGHDALEAAALAGLLNELILKPAFGRERPRNTGGQSEWNPFEWGDKSFPSGHATVSFAVASAFAAHSEQRGLAVAAYAFATLVALSRVEQNAHFLGDVVAGAALGTATGQFVARRHGAYAEAPGAPRAAWRLAPTRRGLTLLVVW